MHPARFFFRRLVRTLGLMLAALLSTAAPVRADAIPEARVGTEIVWAEADAALPADRWTVTAVAGTTVEIDEMASGIPRKLEIAHGVFPAGATARFDRSRLAALPPLEPGRVVTFDAEEGAARWFVHVAVTGRHEIEVPAGRFDVVVVEHHRRGTASDGSAAETLTEWSVALAIGLPVAIRAWRLSDGRAEQTLARRAAMVRLP